MTNYQRLPQRFPIKNTLTQPFSDLILLILASQVIQPLQPLTLLTTLTNWPQRFQKIQSSETLFNISNTYLLEQREEKNPTSLFNSYQLPKYFPISNPFNMSLDA